MMSPRQKLPTSISSHPILIKTWVKFGVTPLEFSWWTTIEDIMVLMQELLATRGYDVVAVPDAAHAEDRRSCAILPT